MRRAAALLLFVLAACSSPEPAAELQPTGRSLLPPSAEAGSPEPSPSSTPDGRAGGADAGDGGSGGPAPTAGTAAAKPTAAPAPTPTKKPEKPGIDGQVLAGGQPVTDAQVTISGNGYHHNTTTSSSGRFRSATPPGTYTVNASSPSVSGCGAKTVTVQRNAVSHVTITCGA